MKSRANENLIRISFEEREAPIYRFTTVERILELIAHHKNSLVSPRKWNDPFENLLARLTIRQSNSENFKHPHRNLVYAQCWTFTEETDGTWRIYAPSGNGVRLKTTVHKLHQSLYDSQGPHAKDSCYIGRVDYMTEEQLISLFYQPTWVVNHLLSSGPLARVESLLFKRTAFKHEDEIRLIFLDNLIQGQNGLYHYAFDPSDVIMEITFDPRMDDSLYETYSSILRKMGYSGIIGKSSLYRIPFMEISI
jgi:hypothetical protein